MEVSLMNSYIRHLGRWTVMKLMVWMFAGSVGLSIISLRMES
jgi:hypothetical protein